MYFIFYFHTTRSDAINIQCNGMDISWRHLTELYEKNRSHAPDAGLALLPKLKYEHLHLTSYSKMRVDLAAQVSAPLIDFPSVILINCITGFEQFCGESSHTGCWRECKGNCTICRGV